MLQKIKIKRTAHYFIQIPQKKVESVLFVIHGYAQKADDFLKEFEYLKKSNTLVVAPEGLSIFYNKKRETVASWMTSRHRLDEIIDYTDYLISLFNELDEKYNFKKIGILGFSQGVSTCFRWVAKTSYQELSFFACSGSVPPELTANDFSSRDFNLHYFYGDNDRFLSTNSIRDNIRLLNELSLAPILYEFEGGHEISKKCHKILNHWVLND